MHYTLALVVVLQMVLIGQLIYLISHRNVTVTLPDMVYQPKAAPVKGEVS